MNMTKRLAASRAKINAMKEQLPAEPVVETPDGWTAANRTKRNKPVYVAYATFTKPRNRVRELLDLPLEDERHRVGDVCPHCMGAGRYKNHLSGEVGPCFRCHQKGTLDAKDLAYFNRRLKGAGPICHIRTA